MKQIIVALHEYHGKYGTFPPATVCLNGQPIHSWRVLILESLDPERYERYRFDEPWNSPHNSSLALPVPHIYQCQNAGGKLDAPITHYVAVVGPGTILRGCNSLSLSEVGRGRDGEVWESHEDVRSVALVAETDRSDIHWMSPVDVFVERDTPSEVLFRSGMISSSDPEGPVIGLADGVALRLKPQSVVFGRIDDVPQERRPLER